MERNLKELVAQMTLEEKAGMCSGLDFWHLKGVERLGIPSVMVSDGPHGLRKQDESGRSSRDQRQHQSCLLPSGSFKRLLFRQRTDAYLR